jgi:hypothetical protein
MLEQVDAGIATTDREQELQACEAIIARGLKTFFEIGTALLAIRDKRLYRVTHKTFESYCRERWEMSKPYAYQLMDAARVAGNLSAIANTPKPIHESQVRPLAKLKPEAQRDVWSQAVKESNGHIPTAEKVDRATSNWLASERRKRQQAEWDYWTAVRARSVTNASRMEQERQESQARSEEKAKLHQLCRRIIDTGYKALATKLHPDKGGSPEVMARLNRARDTLKRGI